MIREAYTVTFEGIGTGPETIFRIRRMLKVSQRSFGLRALAIMPAPATAQEREQGQGMTENTGTARCPSDPFAVSAPRPGRERPRWQAACVIKMGWDDAARSGQREGFAAENLRLYYVKGAVFGAFRSVFCLKVIASRQCPWLRSRRIRRAGRCQCPFDVCDAVARARITRNGHPDRMDAGETP